MSTYVDEMVTTFVRLAAQGAVKVMLDSSVWGVQVPERHMHNPTLVLDFARPRGARDWSADEDGLAETMSFDGVRSVVKVPWEAVRAMAGREDLPQAPPQRPALRLVKGGA